MNVLRRSADFLFLAVLLAFLVGLFSGLSDHFWSFQTFHTVANRIPPLALATLGMTFVLIAGASICRSARSRRSPARCLAG